MRSMRRFSSIQSVTGASERLATSGSGRRDELRLAAVALRRHDHAPGDRVRHLGAELLPQQVQARIEARGRAGARDDAPVLHVQHVGVDVDRGVHRGHRVGVHPVRRRAAAVENAGCREHERAAADAQQPCTARGGVADDIEHPRVDARPLLARRRRDHDEVGLVGEREVVVDVDREARAWTGSRPARGSRSGSRSSGCRHRCGRDRRPRTRPRTRRGRTRPGR